MSHCTPEYTKQSAIAPHLKDNSGINRKIRLRPPLLESQPREESHFLNCSFSEDLGFQNAELHSPEVESDLVSTSDIRYRNFKHDCSLRCLITCTEWRLQVIRNTEGEDEQQILGDFFSPTVSYKRCTKNDKTDLIDLLVARNANQASGHLLMKDNMGVHPTLDVSDASERSQLERKLVTFPIKNKTKASNSTLTNFQFDQKIKEDTFTLTFDISALDLKVNSSITSNDFMFNINGYCHDQPVFSDGIFYMFKGGKMLNCSLSQINKNLISQIMNHQPYIQTAHVFKANNLPKSFGCLLKLSEEAL